MAHHQARTEDVAARLALQDLALDYAVALDERDAAAFGALFTEDAQLVVYEPGVADPLLSFDGRDAIASLLERFDQWGATMHMMTNHRVKLDGDAGTGLVYGLAHHTIERDGRPHTLVMTLHYIDDYRRDGDAGWRFARRKIVRLWNEARPLMDERAAF
jgi:ketosteroid isomerase-like protein